MSRPYRVVGIWTSIPGRGSENWAWASFWPPLLSPGLDPKMQSLMDCFHFGIPGGAPSLLLLCLRVQGCLDLPWGRCPHQHHASPELRPSPPGSERGGERKDRELPFNNPVYFFHALGLSQNFSRENCYWKTF